MSDITAGITYPLVRCPECGLELDANVPVCPNDGTKVIATPEVGEIFQEKYEFVERRAAGGMGVVFKARQKGLNRTVAIKVLQSRDPSSTSVMRFQQEAKTLATLDHTNLVHIFELGITAYGQPYSVMEYVDGIGLDELLRDRGRPSLQKVINIMTQVCDALSYVHEYGIYHRDLKPSNIMLVHPYDDDPKVKLVDFGIAKVLDSDSAHTLTKTGEFCGSPNYMSPEQAKGAKLDHRTDIYSLGCVMYEMLTGSPPFAGGSMMEILFKQVGENPRLLNHASKQKFPNVLETLVSKLLEKEPDNRYQTAADLKKDLLALAGQQKSWYHISLPKSSSSGMGTRVLAAAIALGLLMTGLAVYAICSFLNEKPVKASTHLLSENGCMMPLNEVENITTTIDQLKSGKSAECSDLAAVALMTQKDQITPPECARAKHFMQLSKRKDRYVISLTAETIDDAGLNSLPDFPLRNLKLKGAHLTSSSMKRLSQLSTLQNLDMSHIKLTASDLQQLSKLSRLDALRLRDCDLDDDGIKYIAKLKNLRLLDLSNNPRLTDAAAHYLAASKSPLYDLDLSGSHIADKGAADLSSMQTLDTLKLAQTQITDKGFLQLGALKDLRLLDLSSSNVTQKGLADFKSVRLFRLVLTGCIYSGDSFSKFKQHNPECLIFPYESNTVK